MNRAPRGKRKFSVPIIFTHKVVVEFYADSIEQATEIATKQVGCTFKLHSSVPEDQMDWEIPRGEKVVKRPTYWRKNKRIRKLTVKTDESNN